jgi:hypothetical protein
MDTSHRRTESLTRLHLRERTLAEQYAMAQRADEQEQAATLAWLMRLVRAERARLEHAI